MRLDPRFLDAIDQRRPRIIDEGAGKCRALAVGNLLGEPVEVSAVVDQATAERLRISVRSTPGYVFLELTDGTTVYASTFVRTGRPERA